MTKCAVLFCKNNSGRTSNVSYHPFPADPYRKRKWTEAVRRQETWIPTKHHRICSIHFASECYNTNAKKQKKLHKDACPTLHLHEIHVMPTNSSADAEKDTNEEPDQQPSIAANLSGPPSDSGKTIVSPGKERLKRKIKEKNRKIKRLQYQNRCLKKKVASLQEILDSLTNKSLITDEYKIMLEKIGGKK